MLSIHRPGDVLYCGNKPVLLLKRSLLLFKMHGTGLYEKAPDSRSWNEPSRSVRAMRKRREESHQVLPSKKGS